MLKNNLRGFTVFCGSVYNMRNMSAIFNTFRVYFESHYHGNIQPYSNTQKDPPWHDGYSVDGSHTSMALYSHDVIDESLIKGIHVQYSDLELIEFSVEKANILSYGIW